MIRQLYVQRIGIGFGVNGNRLNIEFLAGTDDAHCDFTAIGDQDAFEHGRTPLGLQYIYISSYFIAIRKTSDSITCC